MADPDYDPLMEDEEARPASREDTAPEDDFLEAAATDSISEEDEGPEEDYETEDEIDEGVSIEARYAQYPNT